MPSSYAIFLPLIAGFSFLCIFNFTRYLQQRWDGPRLIFTAGIVGVAILVPARLIIILLRHSLGGSQVREAVNGTLPGFTAGYVGTMLCAVTLGVAVPLILNLLMPKDWAAWKTRHQGGLLKKLLTEQVYRRQLVSFSMDDNKYYVGIVIERPSLESHEKYFRILPMLSGYRDSTTLQTHLTTNYADLYEKEETPLRNQQLLLQIDSVRSARLFNPKAYKDVFARPLPGEEHAPVHENRRRRGRRRDTKAQRQS